MIHSIKTEAQLLLFLSELSVVAQYPEEQSVWPARKTPEQICKELITSFPHIDCYGKFQDNHRIEYFVVVSPSQTRAEIYLMYFHKDYISKSKDILKQIKEAYANIGIKSLQFVTKNVRPSFQRWAKSLGGKPSAITFNIEL